MLWEALENGVGRIPAAWPSFLGVSCEVSEAIAKPLDSEKVRCAGKDFMRSGKSDNGLGGAVIEESCGHL